MSGWNDRIADAVTAFAGSMGFVWFHCGAFALWCATGFLGMDPYPFNFLTLVVSLEAIFLSTFILISQNRATAEDRLVLREDHDLDAESLAILRRLIERD